MSIGMSLPRRGISLVELLAVMTATVVVTGIATGLVHRSLERQSVSRRALERERAVFAASRQFRADVRLAATARRPAAGDPLLVVSLVDAAQVSWRRTDEGLARLVVDASGRRRREDYRLAEPGASPDWQIRIADGLVTLSTRASRARMTGSGETAAGESDPGDGAIPGGLSRRPGDMGGLSRSPGDMGGLSRSPLWAPEVRVEIVARLPEGADTPEAEE